MLQYGTSMSETGDPAGLPPTGGQSIFEGSGYASMQEKPIEDTKGAAPPLPDSPAPESTPIPATPDGYEINRGEWANHPDYSEDVERGFKQFAHENHMTPKQVQGAYDFYMKNLAPDGGVSEEDGMKVLGAEWGGELQANVDLARSTFVGFADEKLIEKVERTGLGNDPAIIKLFHNIGLKLKGQSPQPANLFKTDQAGRVRLSYPSMER